MKIGDLIRYAPYGDGYIGVVLKRKGTYALIHWNSGISNWILTRELTAISTS